MAKNYLMFGITWYWSTAALDPGAWYKTVCEGACRLVTVCVREEENASKHRQIEGKAEMVDKDGVAPGVTGGSLGHFRAALTQGLPKRPQLRR